MATAAWKPKFALAVKRTYAGQAKYWMNAFWFEGAEKEAENVWKFAQKMIELDQKKKKEGNELEEWLAHQFLEQVGETHTVIDLREKLRKMDIDCNKRVALLEFLLFHYNKDVNVLVNKPQGDSKEIEEAELKMKAVQAALEALQKKLDEQKQAAIKQKQLEEAAAEAIVRQKAAEEELRKAEEAQRAALEELFQQEKALKTQLEKLEKLSKDPQAGAVAKNKAAAELAQLKAKDPLPLQKAKITQQAALKRVERERKAKEEAVARADADRRAAIAAREAAEEQARQVEKSIQETEVAFNEAVKAVEEAKQHSVSHGDIWWMERELAEARKYMPQSKQTARK